MIKAASIDHAIEIASRIAGADGDIEIEIGPVVEPWDLGVMAQPADAPQRFLLLRKADARPRPARPSPPVVKR